MNFHQPRALVFLSIFLMLLVDHESVSAQQEDRVPGDVLVMLKSSTDMKSVVEEFDAINGRNANLTILNNISKRMNIWQLHFDEGAIDGNTVLGLLKQNSDVIIAQFNHYSELRNTPDDTFFPQQWNMLNIGQVNGSTPGADVRATSAWDLTTGGMTQGGDTIILAVVDDGMDLNHEDLKFWKNYAEIPANNIDDDNNGYIDDYDGWNAVNGNGVLPVTNHGTEMAGVGGAIGNNGKGVAGINWTIQIMPLKGVGTEAQTVEAYTYVMDMRKRYNDSNGTEGAFVVATNSSFGVNNGQPANFPLWCAMYDSLGKYGILNAASTTNSNVNVDVVGDIPTACPSDFLISVTNTNSADELNACGYGSTTIDLGAPGTGIWTTIPNNGYTTATGTSPASPHVTGCIALMYSLACSKLTDDYRNDPEGTALRIKGFILDGVDTLSNLEGKTVTGGRLNVYNALELEAAYYDCSVGIEEVSSTNKNLIVYPNPANDNVNVMMKNFNGANVNLDIRNVLGQTMMQINAEPKARSLSIDISHFEKGIYFLAVSDEKSTSVIRFAKE